MSAKRGRRGSPGAGGPVQSWPDQMRCMECEAIGRIYPFPFLEDGFVEAGPFQSTVGTFWCPRCSPPWGAFLLEQLTLRSIHTHGFSMPAEPALPAPGGLPVDDIAFLESELADFFETPGPLMELRPHHNGPGPRAAIGDAFEAACWALVAWMREARLIGYVTGNDMVGRPMIPKAVPA